MWRQVSARKKASAQHRLEQPMLASVYKEAPAWTPSQLIRSAAITLVSGCIAGAPTCRSRYLCLCLTDNAFCQS